MDSDKQIDFLIVITDRKKKDEIVTLLKQNGARIVSTIYGKGSVKAGFVKDIFGFVPEENKSVSTCLLLREKADALIDKLNNEYHFGKPNTGIAFSVHVDGLSY